MAEFKVGDWVRCVDNEGVEKWLKKDALYQVGRAADCIYPIGIKFGFVPERFVPARAPFDKTPYATLAREISEIVAAKQQAYGDSFGKSGDVLRTLYPDGIKTEQYGDLLTITRILDKLFRVATDKDALGESPYRDIAGYALLALGRGGGGVAK